MKIKNITTGNIEDLIHEGYEIDYVPDLIAGCEGILWNDAEEIHEASTEEIEWWNDYLQRDKLAMDEIKKIRDMISLQNFNVMEDHYGNEHNLFDVFEDDLIDSAQCDLEDQPSNQMEVCKSWIRLLEHLRSSTKGENV